MPNSYFKFKEFTIWQDQCAMKVSTLACVLGAYTRYDSEFPIRILDIGSGTGLLSLMMAQRFSNALVDAIEIEENAYLQAKQNILNSSWSERISLYQEDFLKYDFEYKYDLIISNPPFFESNLRSPDPKINLARHDSGLKAEPLVRKVKTLLKENGHFYLLLPQIEMERIISICQMHLLFPTRKLEILNFEHKPPKAVIACFSGKNIEMQQESLIIRKNQKEYTDEFKWLLKAFYLHL